MNKDLFINTRGQCTKMKFTIKNIFSKCDQIGSFLQIWSHLVKKSVMENFIFCAVGVFYTLELLRLKSNDFV